jgi:phage-related minor tail protein
MEEFVCADGRMSVNGVCYIAKTPDQGNDNNTILPPPPSSKNNFEWSFDKVGDTVGNFNDTLTENLTSFNSYVSEKLGVENIAKTAATGLALGPMAVPYMIGKSMFDKFQTNQNNITTDKTMKDPQGDVVTYDMMTYNNQPQDYGQGGASQQTQSSYEDSSGSYTGQGEATDWGGGE